MRFAFLSLSLLLAACAVPTEPEEGTSTDDLTTVPACLPTIACEAPKLSYQTRGWRRWSSTLVSRIGDPHHRGRDMFVNPGAPQWVLGKITYGLTDKDLRGEEVDVFVQRDCASGWEKVGTAVTTHDGEHAAMEGVADNGGRVYFEIPRDKRLGPGRHRVRLVVAGDGTFTDSFIDVVPRDTKIFVSDVDGTLTESENAEYLAIAKGVQPGTHPGAPEALRALVAKGYRPMYLTARPEILTSRTREFLEKHGFPPGIIHTSSQTTGAGVGSTASSFKSDEMKLLAEKGLTPTFAFGNKSTDSEAYTSVTGVEHRVFYKIEGAFDGRRIESYEELVPGYEALPEVCK
ncbi:MAG: phosphatidylinositol transfer protein [Labilithrix sp.]|nr:phosphatidylinositol transfer protein [Labilithrix sp.]MCW5811722.1 phosphatidylinositol transfer protein [Labilithrix sp.]